MKTTVTRPIEFVSLSAGDPELITMKSVRLLQSADIVIVPETGGKPGVSRSRAKEIVMHYCDESKIRQFAVVMSRNRSECAAPYADVLRAVKQFWMQGLCIVVAVVGDISIYASIHYVLDELRREGIEVAQVAGIPSFVAAASSQNMSLVSHDERLAVVPGNAGSEELMALLTNNYVVVVMKLSMCQEQLKALLQTTDDIVCHYFENVGLCNEFHTTDKNVIINRSIPYFSLAVLRKKKT